tara:strand:- start:1478 stop:1588 length:111 start_codon:yes stop_codon:yes gene_type:complete
MNIETPPLPTIIAIVVFTAIWAYLIYELKTNKPYDS